MYNKLFSVHIILVCMCLLQCLFPIFAYAATYEPGETLNPTCLPTDAQCTVTPPLTGNAATSTFNGNVLVLQNTALATTTTTSLSVATITVSSLASTTNLTVSNLLSGVQTVTMNTTPLEPTYAEGNMYWDTTNKTLLIEQGVGDVKLQVGQEMYIRARNSTGATIADGTVVYINGAQGTISRVAPAQANAVNTAEQIGVATHDIANNTEGLVTVAGVVNGINTNAYEAGDLLYLSATAAGETTNVPPEAPNLAVRVGIVLSKSPAQGRILVVPHTFYSGTSSADSLRIHGALTVLQGNVSIGTSTTNSIHPLLLASGAHVTSGGVWTNASDKNIKENTVALDVDSILTKIENLPITRWNYKGESPSIMHIGPMAQDFYEIFGLGGSDTSISTIDPAGIALLGIQGLLAKIQGIGTWLGDSTNKLADIFTQRIHVQRLCLQRTDGSERCITAEEVDMLMNQ